MPGEQGDASRRLAGILDAPAVHDRCSDSSWEFPVKGLKVVKRPRHGYCYGTLKGLRFQQSGHRLVVLAMPIQHLSQVVCCPDTDQRIGSRTCHEIPEHGFRLFDLPALSLKHRISEQNARVLSIHSRGALDHLSRFIQTLVKNVKISQ